MPMGRVPPSGFFKPTRSDSPRIATSSGWHRPALMSHTKA